MIATSFSPADFPIGSPESRAIARSIVEQLNRPTELSEDEWDCLRLYGGASFLNGMTSPGSRDLELTAVYSRGRKLHERRWGPIVPAHLDPKGKRASCASLKFEMVFGREPKAGDVLRFEDVQRIAASTIVVVEWFIDAWKRQLREMPCPLRVDGERIFRRASKQYNSCPRRPRVPADEGYDWEEATDLAAPENWREVELSAFGTFAKEHGITQLATLPHCPAVVFSGTVDGVHQSRAAGETDLLHPFH